MDMIITEELLDKLTDEAKASPRLRMNYDLRTSAEDQSQRMLNALEPGTEVPIHRHRTTTEVVTVVRGAIRQNFYNDEGQLTETFDVCAGGSVSLFVVPVGAWHKSIALESGTIIFEAKDGKYEPIAAEDVLAV